MVNLIKIKDLCRINNITLKELSKNVGITEVGLQRIMKTNSTKVETIANIARVLKVPVNTFFEDDSFFKINRVYEFVSSPLSKMLLNTYDKLSDKLVFLRDYYVFEVQQKIIKNEYPDYPLTFPGGPKSIFDMSIGTIAFNYLRVEALSHTPYSKMQSNVQKAINTLPYLFDGFYFPIFTKNILNIKDYLNEGLIKDKELIHYWNKYNEILQTKKI